MERTLTIANDALILSIVTGSQIHFCESFGQIHFGFLQIHVLAKKDDVVEALKGKHWNVDHQAMAEILGKFSERYVG